MKLPNCVAGICFDIGGTITHMERGALAQEIADRLSVPRALVRELLIAHGKRKLSSSAAVATAVAAGCGQPGATQEIQGVLDARQRDVRQPLLFQDAELTLRALQRLGWRMFFFSNAVGYLESREDPPFFAYAEAVVQSWQTGWCKPEREAFAAVEAVSGLAPRELVCVGNSIDADIEGALAAGWSAVYIHRDTPDAATCDQVPTIYSLAELLDLLPDRPPVFGSVG